MAEFCFSFDSDVCKQCNGFCCRGESGYIFVEYSEIEQIASFLHVNIRDITQQFVKKVGYKLSLTEKIIHGPNGREHACCFFDEQKECCSIYHVRPQQCRSFPFWDKFKNAKFQEVKKECPYVESL